ncbi:MAG: hypothetical protein FWG17_03890 [Desulfovibrionaceae bacterium]|nr:hypothetical protein [Desulfovibrionaceae bacterium]
MKIRNDPLQISQEQGEIRRKTDLEGFESLLARELQQVQDSQTAPAPEIAQSASVLTTRIRTAQEVTALPEDTDKEAFMTRLDELLGQWEQYAATLNDSSGAALKNIHHLLGDLGGQISGLKASMPESAAGLRGLVNELEVLAITEEFKLNRGDYL